MESISSSFGLKHESSVGVNQSKQTAVFMQDANDVANSAA